MTRDGSSAWNRVPAALGLFAAVLLAAVLTTAELGRRPLWFDETVSVDAARLPAGSLAHYLFAAESNLALYHVLLHVWLLLGHGEALARSLSVLFALATLPVIYVLALRLFDRRAAIISVLLLAGNVAFVGHAREARGYSLAVLLVAVSALLLVVAVEDGTRRNWALYVLFAALAVYAHLFAALAVGAQLVSLTAVRGKLDARRALAAVAALAVLVTPIVASAVAHGQSGQIDWLGPPSARQLPGLLAWYTDSVALDLLYLAAGVLAAGAALTEWRRHRRIERLWPYAFLVCWLVLPALSAFALSSVKPVYLYRYFLFSLPALIVLAAAGLARLRPLWLALAATLLAVGLSTRTTAACLPDCKLRYDDWRGAAAYIDGSAMRGDAIVFDPGELRTGVGHYARRRPELLYPERWPLAGGRREGARTPTEAVARAGRYERVWLVTWWLPEGKVAAQLARRWKLRDDRSFAGNVRVRLYVRRPQSA